jgi:hypothetical protein
MYHEVLELVHSLSDIGNTITRGEEINMYASVMGEHNSKSESETAVARD